MKDFTLRQIEYFLAVLDQGSVSAAAKESRVSQATVSAALGQLEKQLGVTLLARGPARRARPTSEGREFAVHARAIVATVTEAVESIDDAAHLQGGLRIGCIPTAAPRILPGVAAAFSRDFPALDITFHEASPVECQRRVLDGEIDIAVMYLRQLQFSGLHQHEIMAVRPHAAVAADHPLAGQTEMDLRDLRDDPFILLDSPPTADLLIAQMRTLGLEPRVRWLIPDAETIRSMVAMGLGVSIANAVPHPTTRSFHGLPLDYIPLNNPELSNTIIAVTAAETRMSKKLTTALSTLRTIVEETDPIDWHTKHPGRS